MTDIHSCAWRVRVWIEQKKMSAGKAAHEIACMEEMVKDYLVIAEKDRLL